MKRVVLLLLLTVSLGADWPWIRGGDNWQPALYTEGRAGNFRKGGGALLFAPLGQDCRQILFAQARAGLFRELYAGTLGGGFRRIDSWWGWGVNAFFDIARSNSKRAYYQGGIGGELFGDCWIFRANGYWPSRNRHTLDSRRTSDVFVIGNNIFSTDTMFDNVEQGYHGFDLEVGRGLQIGCGQLWGYAGYYHFDANKAQSQQGPRLRLEYTLDDFMAWCPIELTLGGEWEHNKRHGSTASGYASVRLPLWTGCNMGRSVSCCESMCRIIGDPVFRNRAIWVDREVLLGNCATIQLPQNIFFFDSAGGGGGTQAAPDTAAGAVASSGVNDILFALADTGLITLAAPLAMQANQQLYSFGPNGQAVIDLGDGRQLTVNSLSGVTNAAATLIGDGGAFDMVTLSTSPVVNGLIIDGNVQDALTGLNGLGGATGTLHVVDVAIQQIDSQAIIFDSYAVAKVQRCNINNSDEACSALNATQQNGLNLSFLRTSLDTLSTGISFGYAADNNQLIARGCTLNAISSEGIIPTQAGLTRLNLLVDDCQFDNMLTAVQELSGLGTIAPGARNALAVLTSRIGTVTPLTETAVEINNPLSMVGPMLTRESIAVARNQINVSASSGDIFGYDQASPFTAGAGVVQRSAVQENVVVVNSSATGGSPTVVGIRATGGGDVCTTVRNNNVTTTSASTPLGTVASIQGVTTGTTVDGNRLSTTMGASDILLDTPPGFVTDLSVLGSLNLGASTDVTGFTDTVIPCQLP